MDKRVFLGFLVLILLVTCFLTPQKEVDSVQIFEDSLSSKDRMNDTVSLELLDSDTFLIDGEGILYGSDIDELLKQQELKTEDLVHLIIGDHINELEYRCLHRYPSLQTVKIGENVRWLHNSVLRNCVNLQYVFLPKSLEKVGLDFLLDCPKWIKIVTDNTEDRLYQYYDFHEQIVLDQVFSYESLYEKTRDLEIPYKSITADECRVVKDESGETDDTEDCEMLESPEIDMDAGQYRVTISGTNLNCLNESCLSVRVPDGNVYQMKDIQIQSERISYILEVERKIEDIKYCINYDELDNTIMIDKMEILQIENEELPSAIRQWFSTIE